MRLDRNIAGNGGRGKYALLKLREINAPRDLSNYAHYKTRIAAAIALLEEVGILDWGEARTDREFFVVRLKDHFALPALKAYAAAAEDHDFEYGTQVRELAMRSGKYSEFCKLPD